MRSIFVGSLLVLCFRVEFATAKSCYGHSELSDGCARIIEVAAYGDPTRGDKDHRKTEEEFATSTGEDVDTIRDRFSPTGTLICTGGTTCPTKPSQKCKLTLEGSAQLTAGTDVITTVGHILENPDTCALLAKAQDCMFTIKNASGSQAIKVDSLVDQGMKCPTIPTPNLDWAVMKLSRKVVGVTPYRLDSSRVQKLKAGDQVLNVCHSADFIRSNSNPKHINACEIKTVYYSYRVPVLLSTNCDMAESCSGGSMLNGNEADPVLLGIASGNQESADQLKSAIKSHRVNMAPYDEQNWADSYIPISGDFLDAIKRASALSASRDSF